MNRRAALVFSLLAIVTYMQDVKPILDARCIECHASRAELNLAEFPFSGSIGDQSSIASRILNMTSTARMPPGNRPRLSAGQLDTIRAWIAGGLQP